MAAPEWHLLVTCEHGGHRVPLAYRSLFEGRDRLLRSHRGWDPGALLVARGLARAVGAPLIAATTTRLLVDLNRSPHNPRVVSELTRPLPRGSREELIAHYHRPHWDRVRAAVVAAEGLTVHLAVHSFTSVWKGERRPFTVGILYDPGRRRERSFARSCKQRLASELGTSQIRRNAPYRGDADGLTTAMRREHAPNRYLGIELELNQEAISEAPWRRRLLALLPATLHEAARASI